LPLRDQAWRIYPDHVAGVLLTRAIVAGGGTTEEAGTAVATRPSELPEAVALLLASATAYRPPQRRDLPAPRRASFLGRRRGSTSGDGSHESSPLHGSPHVGTLDGSALAAPAAAAATAAASAAAAAVSSGGPPAKEGAGLGRRPSGRTPHVDVAATQLQVPAGGLLSPPRMLDTPAAAAVVAAQQPRTPHPARGRNEPPSSRAPQTN
jgi:hypothetical protein